MDQSAFQSNAPGELVNTNGDLAFSPDPLPPKIDEAELLDPLADALSALGKLEGIGPRVDNREMLISPFMRKEAVLSSRIEGTRATLSDVFAYEAGNGQTKLISSDREPDVREVVNYVRAMEDGLAALDQTGITVDVIKELNKTLLSGVRGGELNPGEFRDIQNWIGRTRNISDARFVPPPPEVVDPEMRELVDYINEESEYRSLIKIGLVHYQIETIHPFRDGNGRVGRLLISLMLQNSGLLPEPYLYLSSYINEYRDQYTDLLLAVSQEGRWEDWLTFFLNGIEQQAEEAYYRAEQLLELRDEYMQRYQGERSSNILALALEFFEQPYMTIPEAQERLNVSHPTASRAMERLEDDDVVEEITGQSRNRTYKALEIHDILTEPGEHLVT